MIDQAMVRRFGAVIVVALVVVLIAFATRGSRTEASTDGPRTSVTDDRAGHEILRQVRSGRIAVHRESADGIHVLSRSPAGAGVAAR